MPFFSSIENAFKKVTRKVQKNVIKTVRVVTKQPIPSPKNIDEILSDSSLTISQNAKSILNNMDRLVSNAEDVGKDAVEATFRPIAEAFAKQFMKDNKDVLEEIAKAGKKILDNRHHLSECESILTDIKDGNLHEKHDRHRIDNLFQKVGLDEAIRKINR